MGASYRADNIGPSYDSPIYIHGKFAKTSSVPLAKLESNCHGQGLGMVSFYIHVSAETK